MQPKQIKYLTVMGKNNLILGTGRGKLGDIVFYRTGGEQRFRTRVRPTNPRTNAQLIQRCVVSTAVKFYSLVAEICNHAFQNYSGSLKNHQRYMRVNIKYLRALALQNIDSFSPIKFNTLSLGNYTWKDSELVAINEYQVSEGDLPNLSTLKFNTYNGVQVPSIGSQHNTSEKETYEDVANAIGAQYGDQITMIVLTGRTDRGEQTGYIEKCYYGRTILAPATGDRNTIYIGGDGNITSPNKENYGDVALKRANTAEDKYVWTPVATNSQFSRDDVIGFAVIGSRFENEKWRRTTSYVKVRADVLGIANLKNAIESYQKSDTSSLYLNQSKNQEDLEGEFENVRPRAIEEEEEIEIEAKTSRQRKNNKDAE